MPSGIKTSTLLGAAFLVVFAASLLSERLLSSVVGSGSISDKLVNTSTNLTRMRTSNLIALADSLAIVVLSILLYTVFSPQNKIIALIALGFGVSSAIVLAVSKIGTYALMPLSLEYVEAGAPGSSHFQALGDFLYSGIDRQGYHIHNMFYSLGAVLWYYLLHTSRYTPRVLSVWGLVAACLLAILSLLVTYNRDFDHPIVMAVTGLPYLPFEPVLGLWLLIKGF